MILEYELRLVAFTWPNLCSLDLSLLFIVLVGRNFVSGICKLKPKKSLNPTFFVKNLGFFSPALPPPPSSTDHFLNTERFRLGLVLGLGLGLG